VLPVHSLEHWPEGNPPESHEQEYPTVAVKGEWDPVSVDNVRESVIKSTEGFPNPVEHRNNFRGCFNIDDDEVVTFWKVFAPASLKVDFLYLLSLL
jgi:hypothetical protein